MNRRTNAFTIMEMTVAMLVAAIAIGITYTCYTIITKNYLGFKTHQQDLVEISQINQVLGKDLDKATLILSTNAGVVLKNAEHDITYTFLPDYILRLSAAIDTFKIKTKNINRYFEGQQWSEQNGGDEQNRLDEISFTILSGNTEIPYHYFKQYSSQELINRTADAGH